MDPNKRSDEDKQKIKEELDQELDTIEPNFDELEKPVQVPLVDEPEEDYEEYDETKEKNKDVFEDKEDDEDLIEKPEEEDEFNRIDDEDEEDDDDDDDENLKKKSNLKLIICLGFVLLLIGLPILAYL